MGGSTDRLDAPDGRRAGHADGEKWPEQRVTEVVPVGHQGQPHQPVPGQRAALVALSQLKRTPTYGVHPGRVGTCRQYPLV